MHVTTASLAFVIVIQVSALAPARVGASEQAAQSPAVAGFVPDVTEEEWNAAVPAKGSDVKLKQISGPKHAQAPQGLKLGEKVFATIAIVVRPDGTQGVYKVVATNNPALALELVGLLRKQRFKPPTQRGVVVAVRGEISEEFVRTR